jgi:protein SCO1/2
MDRRSMSVPASFAHHSHPLLLTAAISLGALWATASIADNGISHSAIIHGSEEAHTMQEPMPMDPASHTVMENHAAHMKMMSAPTGYERSITHYPLPDTELVDADGKPVQLKSLLAEERPVILNFIFTSCTTVCPILTATLSQASKAFQDDEMKPLLLSISIDPQYDTPARLREYAARYHAGDNWHFLTGDLDSVMTLQRAFHAYYGTKLNHQPITFLRRGPHQPWLRLQGFTRSSDLVTEYRALLDSRS